MVTPLHRRRRVLHRRECGRAGAVLPGTGGSAGQPVAVDLRNGGLRAELAQVSEQTGLRFRVPDRSYASVKAPYFYSLAADCQAMDSLARVFSIPDFTWHQLGNGEMFAGSWADSFFGAHAPLQIPTELLDGFQGNKSAMVAALPGLRP